MATIVQVADLARVSPSTVSHVLNGTRHVEPDTRQRVVDAIKATSYRQDALARALRRSRTDSIGLIISDAAETTFAEIMHGVETASAERGLTLLLANSGENRERESNAVKTLLERRVDGLILARAADSDDEVIEQISRDKAHLVLLDRTFDLPYDQVSAQQRQPMQRLVRHLIDGGHRRLAIIPGDTRIPTLADRLLGFWDAISQGGLSSSEQHVIAQEPGTQGIQFGVVDALRRDVPPTVLIACSTLIAVASLYALKDEGVRIPDDIAFATFDGFMHSDLFDPQVTTVRPPAFEVGATAVKLLADRMGGLEVPARRIELAQTIEYRASTEDFFRATS